MKKRNALHKLARQTQQALDWDRYRSYRNQIKEKLREAKSKFVYIIKLMTKITTTAPFGNTFNLFSECR
jgi:hypothetical protein